MGATLTSELKGLEAIKIGEQVVCENDVKLVGIDGSLEFRRFGDEEDLCLQAFPGEKRADEVRIIEIVFQV